MPRLETQQKVFDAFQWEYHNVRPHERLNQKTPASQYNESPRPYPRGFLCLSIRDIS